MRPAESLSTIILDERGHRIRRYRYPFGAYTKRPQKAVGEHPHIVEAIDARDGDRAEMRMRRHLRSARQNSEKHLKENS